MWECESWIVDSMSGEIKNKNRMRFLAKKKSDNLETSKGVEKRKRIEIESREEFGREAASWTAIQFR